MSEPQDKLLIEQILEGDESAFAVLVSRYEVTVNRTVRRMFGNSRDNEDAVQEVFFRAYNSLARFDTTYPFAPWIIRITTNYCIDQLRHRRLMRYCYWADLNHSEQQRAMKHLSRNGDFAVLLQQAPEAYERVALRLLEELKPKYRIAFVLRELEGMSYEDVARSLGTSENAARVRVFRARDEIRRKFRDHIKRNGYM